MGFNSFSYQLGNLGVKCFRHNVVFVQFIIRNQTCNGIGSSKLHLFCNLCGTSFQGTLEDTGESDNVIDLIREVASAGSYDFCTGNLSHGWDW